MPTAGEHARRAGVVAGVLPWACRCGGRGGPLLELRSPAGGARRRRPPEAPPEAPPETPAGGPAGGGSRPSPAPDESAFRPTRAANVAFVQPARTNVGFVQLRAGQGVPKRDWTTPPDAGPNSSTPVRPGWPEAPISHLEPAGRRGPWRARGTPAHPRRSPAPFTRPAPVPRSSCADAQLDLRGGRPAEGSARSGMSGCRAGRAGHGRSHRLSGVGADRRRRAPAPQGVYRHPIVCANTFEPEVLVGPPRVRAEARAAGAHPGRSRADPPRQLVGGQSSRVVGDRAGPAVSRAAGPAPPPRQRSS
jgi:hypothetical protein